MSKIGNPVRKIDVEPEPTKTPVPEPSKVPKREPAPAK